MFHHHHHYHHQSFNREGLWGITDDFATSFLYFSLFSTALWDLPNSRPVHSLMLSSHLSLCLPCLLPPFTVPCKMVLARPDERETWPYHCSLHLFTVVVFVWSNCLFDFFFPAGKKLMFHQSLKGQSQPDRVHDWWLSHWYVVPLLIHILFIVPAEPG